VCEILVLIVLAFHQMKEEADLKNGKEKAKHSISSRKIVWYGNEDIHRERGVEAKEGVAGSNNLYRFGSRSKKPGELLISWLACPEGCEKCFQLQYDECEHRFITNFRSGSRSGSSIPNSLTVAMKKDIKLKLPSIWRQDDADGKEIKEENENNNNNEPPVALPHNRDGADDDGKENEEENNNANNESPEASIRASLTRSSRRSRRIRKGPTMAELRRGLTFCIRAACQHPDVASQEIWCARVSEVERKQGALIFYNYYVEDEEKAGLYKLGKETHMCSAGDMLPPYGWRMTVYDDESGLFSVDDALARRFSNTVANIRL